MSLLPKLEIDYYFDIQDELFNEMNIFSKKVAIGIEKAIKCERIGVSVIGLEVPHAHIHLIPINSISDMNFSNPKLVLTEKEFLAIEEEIKKEISL